MAKRVLSLVLVLSMLVGIAPAVFAKAEPVYGPSLITFSAAEYNISENGESYDITVVREGGNALPIDVAFKTADVFSEYGKDYVVIVDGEELEAVDGIAPTYSDFKEDVVTGADKLINAKDDDGATKEETAQKIKESAESPSEDKTVIDNNGEEKKLEAVELESVKPDESENAEPVSRGTAILDAEAALLNLPSIDRTQASDTGDVLVNVLRETNNYFNESRGAYGVLHFDEGETEKTFTIRTIDNDKAQADKMVLLSLMGINGDDEAELPANPTATVNILDDEEYEKPIIEPDTTYINLDRENWEYDLCLRRTCGIDYYTFIYVSTVSGSAVEGRDYDKITDAKVSFAPGETEKIVKVRGKNFSDDVCYGIRLWSDGTNDITNEYIDVNLMSKTAAEQAQEADTLAWNSEQSGFNLNDADNASLNELGTIGSQTYGWYKLDNFGGYDSGHWAEDDDDHAVYSSYSSSNQWTDVGAWEGDKWGRTGFVFKTPVSTYGLQSVKYYWTCHEHNGKNDNNEYYTHFGFTSSGNKFNDNYSYAHASKQGAFGWSENTVGFDNNNPTTGAYMKFHVISEGYGREDPDSMLGNPLYFNMRKYTLSNAAKQIFYNYLYDYVDNTISYIPMEESGDLAYFAPEVVLKSGDQLADTFYPSFGTSGGTTAMLVPNGELKHGVKLGNVMFTADSGVAAYKKENLTPAQLAARFGAINKSADRSNPVGESFVWANTWEFPSSTVINLNQSFIKTVYDKTNNKYSNNYNFKVMPKYYREPSVVKVYTGVIDPKTGRPSLTVDGLYNAATAVREGDRYYNEYKFSLDSKLRIKVTNNAAGYQLNDYTVIYGGNKIRESKRTSDVLTFAEEKPTIHMDSTQVSIYPNSKGLNFDVMLNPNPDIKKPQTNGKDAPLEGIVIEGITSTMSSQQEQPQLMKTDEKGYLPYTKNPVYPGMLWYFQAIPPKDGAPEDYEKNPDKYYTVWLNGTGDENNNGKIDPWEENENTRKVGDAGYEEIVGNFINGTINQDNPKMYYFFRPIDNTADKQTFSGRVRQVYGNFLMIANMQDEDLIREENLVPVGGTINIANTEARIDPSTGIFSAELKGVPVSGRISFKVKANSMDRPYYGTTLLNRMNIILPPYDTFKPQSSSISYANMGPIYSHDAEIMDDVFTMTAQVRDAGTLKPRSAKFYHYDVAKKTFTDMETYDKQDISDKKNRNKNANIKPTVTFDAVSNTATLVCNPLYNLDTGDKIYVEFYDQFGNSYGKMDMGYSFTKSLTLDRLVLGMIGSSTFETAYHSIFDLIGDPFGDLSLGTAMITTGGKAEDDGAGNKVVKYRFGDPNTAFNVFEKEIEPFKAKQKEREEKHETETEADKKEKTEGTKKAIDEATKKEGGDGEDAGYSTETKFSFVFNLKLALTVGISGRVVKDKDGNDVRKNYFENASFLAGIEVGFDASVTVSLPLGLSVMVGAGIVGKLTAVYQMQTKYEGDPMHSKPENLVEYAPGTFGLFNNMPKAERTMYLFFDPDINLHLGVSWLVFSLTGTAHFMFDMDFEFGMTNGETYQRRYGRFFIQLDYKFTMFGLSVKTGKTDHLVEKELFSFKATGPNDISPDMSLFSADDAIDEGINEAFADENTEINAVPVSRDYLGEKSEFIENTDMNLNDIDISENTKQIWEKTHVMPSSEPKLIDMGDEKYILFYIDDAGDSRSDIDRSAVFYRTYINGIWSDETRLDGASQSAVGYLNVSDIGDSIIVSWTEADGSLEDCVKMLEDKVAVDENGNKIYDIQKVMHKLDIRAKLIPKASMSMSNDPIMVTKHSDYDEYADINARFAYDENTNKIFVVYNKVDFESVSETSDLASAANDNSTIAYRRGVLDDETIVLSSDYTQDESATLKQALKMKEGDEPSDVFYGQRFIDTRINHSSSVMPRIQDLDAIHAYDKFDSDGAAIKTNPGVAAIVYLVDEDGNMQTEDDKNIYGVGYDFATDKFIATDSEYPDITCLTYKMGAYFAPKLKEYNDSVYLFMSASGDITGTEEIEELEEQDSEIKTKQGDKTAGIAILSVTDIYKNNGYALFDDGTNHYYRLEVKNTVPEHKGSGGEVIPEQTTTIPIMPVYAVETKGNVPNYTIASGCGKDDAETVYLVWTSQNKESNDPDNQIFVSVYDRKLDLAGQDTGEDNTYFDWSEPFMISGGLMAEDDKPLDKDVFYSGVASAVTPDGRLIVAANRAPYLKKADSTDENDKNVSVDEANTSLVFLEHTQVSNLEFYKEDPGALSTGYLYDDSNFDITANIRNAGDKAIMFTEDNPMVCKFYAMEGDTEVYLGEDEYSGTCGAGAIMTVGINVDRYQTKYDDEGYVLVQGEDSENVKSIKAVVTANGTEISHEENIIRESMLLFTDDVKAEIDKNDREMVNMSIGVFNMGNKDVENGKVTLYRRDENVSVNTMDLFAEESKGFIKVGELNGPLAALEYVDLSDAIEVPDEWYSIDETGRGIARFKVTLADDSGIETSSDEIAVTKDFDIDAINLLKKVTDVKVDGTDKVTVKLNEKLNIPVKVKGADNGEYEIIWKCNNDNVTIALDGTMYGAKAGKATLTGYVVPVTDKVVFGADGNITNPDKIKYIPSNLIKTVAANVTVSDGSKPSGGGGNTPSGGFTPSTEPQQQGQEPQDIPEIENLPFTDVTDTDWFYDAVKYVYDNKIMNGTSETTFEPYAEVTRGMFATVIYRLEGEPAFMNDNIFEDVKSGEYYEKAVVWAQGKGIVNGTSETTFEPDKNITREEMATMLYRYIQYLGGGFHGGWAFPLDFKDADQVSDWAYEAMCYVTMPSVGLMQGMEDGTLQPKNNTNRAELATVLMRYCNTDEK